MKYLTSYSIIGILVTVMGIALILFPPKKINSKYGYKTASSVKSQKRWDLAQPYCGKIMLINGIILFISNILTQKDQLLAVGQHIINIVVLLGGFITLFILVERKLKNQ